MDNCIPIPQVSSRIPPRTLWWIHGVLAMTRPEPLRWPVQSRIPRGLGLIITSSRNMMGRTRLTTVPLKVACLFHNLMMIHVLPVLLIHSLSLSLLPCYFRSEGRHVIDIFYDGIPIPGSPFAVNVRRGCDSKKVKAFGQGLVRGIVNQPNVFTIETRGMLSLYTRISG